MGDAGSEEVVRRWGEAVRSHARSGAVDVFEGWLAVEGAGVVAPVGGGARPSALAERAGRSFVRLGAAARAAGLSLQDLAALLDALRDVVEGIDAGSALATVHGLAAGGWHADASPAPVPLPAAPSGDPFARLDPALGKLIRHDIKTPLQAASLNLELLAMEQGDNPEVTGAIATIMQSLDSAVAMLQRFDDV